MIGIRHNKPRPSFLLFLCWMALLECWRCGSCFLSFALLAKFAVDSITLPTRLTSTKNYPGFESGFLDWFGSGYGSWCQPDLFQNVVDLFQLSAFHFAELPEKRLVTDCMVMLINLRKCHILQCWRKWKVIQNPYPGPDHHQKLIDSSHW